MHWHFRVLGKDCDRKVLTEALSGQCQRIWRRGLLIRRNISDGNLSFFFTWSPSGAGIPETGHDRRTSLGD
jgi:hypothetical protein